MRDYSHIPTPPKITPPTHRPVYFVDGPVAGDFHLVRWADTKVLIRYVKPYSVDSLLSNIDQDMGDQLLDPFGEVWYAIDVDGLPKEVITKQGKCEFAYFAIEVKR